MPTFNNVTIQNASCVFPPPDGDWNNVSFLLKFDTGGATTFVDSSSYNRNVTQAYGINSISASIVKFSYTNAGSLAPSSGASLAVPTTKIGTDNSWTWETWFYRSSAGTYCAFFYESNNASSMTLLAGSSDSTYRLQVRYATFETLTSVSSVPLNTWTYLAVSFDAVTATMRIFINGVLEAQRSGGPFYNINTIFYLCRNDNAGFAELPGYTDEMRFTAGVCRYTSSFTPPTEPFPIGN